MIYRVVLVVAFFLSVTGCAQKAGDYNSGEYSNQSNISDSTDVSSDPSSDTVSIDENNFGSGEESSIDSSDSYNSSADKFRSIYFGFDNYWVTSNMEGNMNTNAKLVAATKKRVKIEGNCDEFGTDEYNYALGLKRAKAVKDRIIAKGVDASRILLVSFGESNPVCVEPSDSCYDRNRRVDIHLVK